MHTALVDGDVLVYICGFAAEEVMYETEDGSLFSTMKQAKTHSTAESLNMDKISTLVEAEPMSHALYLVKNILSRVILKTSAKELRVFLSGKDNFRYDVATIRPYKGNRSSRKPHHYGNIRKYLIDVCKAEVVNGMEADDALGINQSKDSCIVTIDKDLDMIPGYHYNFQRDSLYDVTEKVAVKNFYRQLLTGDSTDNIVGVPKVGPKTADKILKVCKDEEDMFWACLEAYNKAYERPYDALVENGKLLYILQEEGQKWEPNW